MQQGQLANAAWTNIVMAFTQEGKKKIPGLMTLALSVCSDSGFSIMVGYYVGASQAGPASGIPPSRTFLSTMACVIFFTLASALRLRSHVLPIKLALSGVRVAKKNWVGYLGPTWRTLND